MGNLNSSLNRHSKFIRRTLLLSSFSLCLLLCSNVAIGQSSTTAKPFVVSPKSPNVAAMEKYGNFEVNLFHGVPEINIPIFEVKSKGFSIPINLSYHASGIRVSDIASWVGLGWSLNTGGQISRKVKGGDDFSGILSSNPANQIRTPEQIDPGTADGFIYLKSILAIGGPDTEPDVFSYSMPGKFGNFLYKNATTPPILIPSEPIRISRNQITLNSVSNVGFDLLDAQGNQYLFGNSLAGESIRETSTSQTGGTSQNPYTSSWLLTNMISPDKSDTVSYSYYPGQLVTTFQETTDNVYVRDNFLKHTGNHSTQTTIEDAPITSFGTVTQRLLKEILFDNGKIEFSLFANNRADLTAPALDKIRIYSKTKNLFDLLKTVQFYYSYFGSSPKSKLRLDSISVKSADSQLNQTYRFTYENTSDLSVNVNAQDYWGYYNGKYSSNLVPYTIIPYIAGGGLPIYTPIGKADRQPDPSVVQSRILKRIQFPTGGYTVFNYEPNKYSNALTDMIGGGVRVRSIFTYPSENAEPIVKSYRYGTVEAPESGAGYLNSIRNLYFEPTRTRTLAFFEQPEMGNVLYLGTSNDNRNFSSNISYSVNEYDDSNVFYPFVTEYIGSSETNIGKKTYEFSMANDFVVINAEYGFMNQVQSFHWKRGKLLKLKEYEKLTGPSYRLKTETNNFYEEFKPQTIANIGLSVVERNIFTGPRYERFHYSGEFPRPYVYSFYNLYTGAFPLTLSKVKTYGTTNNAETFTEYKYNNSFQPSIIKNLKSNGDTLITRYKYADDYSTTVSSTSGSGIRNLQISNILSLPIEKTVSVKIPAGLEQVVGGEIKTYYDNKPLLKDEYRLETDQPITGYQASMINGSGLLSIPAIFKKRINYTTYDASGNPIEYLVDDKRKNAFVWGYRRSLLIAEVQNAGAGQVAYTSFEEEGKGNWTYNEAAVTSPLSGAVTGRSVFNFAASGSISRTGLSQEPYTVSYWGKKSCLVNGAAPTISSSANSGGWVLYTHKVTPSSGVITIASTDAVIDELRLYPTSAMMNTYTHSPLVGVSATSQSNGNFNVYTYDGLQRLSNVKDQNFAITKNYKYNIPNPRQLTSLPVVYFNDKVSGTFARNNCSSLYYGKTVIYEIAEGAFYSTISKQDAQSKANTALASNGQQYANANGECRLKTEVTWEPINPYCQIKQLNVTNPPTTMGYSLNVQSAPNTTNFASVTVSRSLSEFAVKVNFVIYFGFNNQFTSSVLLEAGQSSKTFNISVYPYTNDTRNGWNVVSIELYNNLYVAGTSFYAQRQKKVGGQVVLTEPNLKGIGEGPYYDVVRSTIPGSSACQSGYVSEIPIKAAYANTDLSVEFVKPCPSGQSQLGARVIYSVPAGKYTSSISQADADAKALAEANANGQAYANANGTCY